MLLQVLLLLQELLLVTVMLPQNHSNPQLNGLTNTEKISYPPMGAALRLPQTEAIL
ncbi:hypothetical protein D3C71_1553090 [compost metagenome]